MPRRSRREITLDDKHLVFLFMMATLVVVGAFLWGVIVGREARVPRAGQEAFPAALVGSVTAARPTEAAVTRNASTVPSDVTYYGRLTVEGGVEEALLGVPSEQDSALAPAPER